MLIKQFNINTEIIKKRNEQLINMKWIDKLTQNEKKFLNWRKGPVSKLMNRDGLFGYTDLSNYLINCDFFNEININHLQSYLSIYDIKTKFNVIYTHEINKTLSEILKKIINIKIKKIKKYIQIENDIFKKGIYSNDVIYRMQNTEITTNIIKNSTSWSLIPAGWPCNREICHLYITKIPPKLRVIYIENNSNDKNLSVFKDFNAYEFEYILPQNIEFKEIKTKTVYITNNFFDNKTKELNKFKNHKIICHYIKIIKKNKNIDCEQKNKITLSVNIK